MSPSRDGDGDADDDDDDDDDNDDDDEKEEEEEKERKGLLCEMLVLEGCYSQNLLAPRYIEWLG